MKRTVENVQTNLRKRLITHNRNNAMVNNFFFDKNDEKNIKLKYSNCSDVECT